MVRDLIQALGGPAAVAEWASANGPGVLKADTVYVWISENREIPWRWRATLRAMADERDLVLIHEWDRALALMAPSERTRAASRAV